MPVFYLRVRRARSSVTGFWDLHLKLYPFQVSAKVEVPAPASGNAAKLKPVFNPFYFPLVGSYIQANHMTIVPLFARVFPHLPSAAWKCTQESAISVLKEVLLFGRTVSIQRLVNTLGHNSSSLLRTAADAIRDRGSPEAVEVQAKMAGFMAQIATCWLDSFRKQRIQRAGELLEQLEPLNQPIRPLLRRPPVPCAAAMAAGGQAHARPQHQPESPVARQQQLQQYPLRPLPSPAVLQSPTQGLGGVSPTAPAGPHLQAASPMARQPLQQHAPPRPPPSPGGLQSPARVLGGLMAQAPAGPHLQAASPMARQPLPQQAPTRPPPSPGGLQSPARVLGGLMAQAPAGPHLQAASPMARQPLPQQAPTRPPPSPGGLQSPARVLGGLMAQAPAGPRLQAASPMARQPLPQQAPTRPPPSPGGLQSPARVLGGLMAQAPAGPRLQAASPMARQPLQQQAPTRPPPSPVLDEDDGEAIDGAGWLSYFAEYLRPEILLAQKR
ncbi:hypothetical protein PLESTB_000853300 [Pleodorina starrii]|uniref:Uncharacterized protein n=1 Tax=Pleodorina starrii TaxID=330485 RepID=A0A9W6F2T8_9CHLO|nr:hypothetical protein PLESTB_000853300 [Pleodorina starrii]